MVNIMSQIRFSNKPSRNAFDLSHKLAFTAKAGELLPIFVKETLPGDKFKISPKWFTRTESLNTAAYTRLTEHIDFYYVPLRILWRYSDSFFAQTDYSQSALSITNKGLTSPQQHPYFSLSSLISLLQQRYSDFYENQSVTGKNLFGFSRCDQTLKLLQYLGYTDLSKYIYNPDKSDQPYLESWWNPFPLLAYQCVYQYFERNDAWEQMRSDFYNVDYLTSTDPSIDFSQLSSSLDDMLDLRYANWRKDLFTGLLPRAQYGDEATVSIIGNGLVPLDLRNEQGNTVPYSSTASIFPYSGLRGGLGVRNSDGTVINNMQSINFPSSVNIGNLSILALRQAEALQRYKEIKQSNKYDYKSQIDAFWNVSASRERANMPTRIGGFVNGINIDEVVNTSITDNGNERQAANIAGKGAGAGNGNIEFNCPAENGIIIGIYKVTPELDYLPINSDRLFMKTKIEDYANPMFDKLGMESLKGFDLIQMFTQEEENAIQSDILSEPLGYAPRYFDYKTAIDRVIGGFNTPYLDTWVAPYNRETIFEQLRQSFNNTGKLLNFGFFKINPMVLNPIFTSQISEDSNSPFQFISDYTNEQFKINMFFDCTAVRNLDYNGLPY